MNLAQTLQVFTPRPKTMLREIHCFIRTEGGKHCVHSHQTGKNFGCYESLDQAKHRLKQMKRFKSVKAQDDDTYYGPNTGGMGPSKALGDPE